MSVVKNMFKCLLLFILIGLSSCTKEKEIETVLLTYPTVTIVSANPVGLTTYEIIIDIDLGNKEKVNGAEIVFNDITVLSASEIIKEIKLNDEQKQKDTLLINLNRLNHDYLVKVKLKSDAISFYSNEKVIRSSKCSFKVSLPTLDDMYRDPENNISSFHNNTDTTIVVKIDFTVPFKEKSIEVKLNDNVTLKHNISFKNYNSSTTGLYTMGGAFFHSNLPSGTYEVSVFIDSIEFKADTKIKVLEGVWSLLSSSFPGPQHREYANFVIGDKLFLIDADPIWQPNVPKVWQCDLKTGFWMSKNDFPVPAGQYRKVYGFTLKSAETGYIVVRNPYKNDSTELWRYKYNEDTWSLITTYPGKGRDIMCFILDDKFYAGCGNRNIDNNYLEYNDFWTYNLTDHIWIQSGNAPEKFSFQNNSSCSGDQKAFIFSYKSLLWEFDPLNNKWTQISKFGGPQRNKTSLVYLNNKIYMVGGEYIDVMTQNLKDCWVYSVQENTWRLNSFLPSYSNRGVAFPYQNHIVAGLGYAVVGYLDIYEPNLYSLTP